MNEDMLLAIDYDTTERKATLVYIPAAEYDLQAIIEYVEDMTDGKAASIEVYEGLEQKWVMYANPGGGLGSTATH